MNYEKMIAVNRIESEQKIKLATMAIEQLIERGEYPSVTLLVKKTGLSRGFFYKNPEVLHIEQDFEKTQALSEEVTLDSLSKMPITHRIGGYLFSLIGPLM